MNFFRLPGPFAHSQTRAGPAASNSATAGGMRGSTLSSHRISLDSEAQEGQTHGEQLQLERWGSASGSADNDESSGGTLLPGPRKAPQMDLKVHSQSGYLARVELTLDLPGVEPEAVWSLLAHPDNACVFRDIKRVEGRSIVDASTPGLRVLRVCQVGEALLMWRRREFKTDLEVEEDTRDPQRLRQTFSLLHSDLLQRFHGEWGVMPLPPAPPTAPVHTYPPLPPHHQHYRSDAIRGLGGMQVSGSGIVSAAAVADAKEAIGHVEAQDGAAGRVHTPPAKSAPAVNAAAAALASLGLLPGLHKPHKTTLVQGCRVTLVQDVLPKRVPMFVTSMPVVGPMIRGTIERAVRRVVEDLIDVVGEMQRSHMPLEAVMGAIKQRRSRNSVDGL